MPRFMHTPKPMLSEYALYREEERVEIYKITPAARELGVSTDFLRKSEKDGRIPLARRLPCGWRIYSREDIEKLRELILSSPASS